MGGEDQAASEDQETEEPGMLELTGEERTIPLSEDTEVVEISMGGRPEGEEPSFYGVGAAILAEEGTVSISESTISTDADGGVGIFAYGNSTVYVADTEIYTEKDTSGGIHAAGGGTLYAWDVSAAMKGESSAAIRSDRGGGTMIVEGGDYTTEGTGSPAVYCTADIAVKDAELNERGWGQEGNNGSDCSFTAISQEMEGDVIWDSISSLYSQGQILDENGNSVSIVGSDGTTYVEGDSSYTVTVDSYENTVDLTEAAESASWDDDQVEQPQML